MTVNIHSISFRYLSTEKENKNCWGDAVAVLNTYTYMLERNVEAKECQKNRLWRIAMFNVEAESDEGFGFCTGLLVFMSGNLPTQQNSKNDRGKVLSKSQYISRSESFEGCSFGNLKTAGDGWRAL